MANRNTRIDLAIPVLMEATMFAAEMHRDQRRKDANRTPYINHPIMVVNLLVNVGKVSATDVLVAGMLHDTIEDTPATEQDLEERFGRTVTDLVLEVTDDKALKKEERKRLQIEHAPHLSPSAKTIKLADKIANLTDLASSPPADWPPERLHGYVSWASQVVAGCRGISAPLEGLFDRRARQVLAGLTAPGAA